MKKFRKYLLFALSVLFFLLAALLENQTLNKHPEARLIQDFQKSLLAQENKLSDYLNSAEKRITDSVSVEKCAATFSDFNQLLEDKGLGFIITRNRKMVYWSSNQFTFPNFLNKVTSQNRLLSLPNGIFITQKRIVGNHELIGLILIKNNYSYENQYLENSFLPPFHLPSDFKILSARSKNSYEIKDVTNQYLFSIEPSGERFFNDSQLYFPVILYVLGFLFFLLSFYQGIKYLNSKHFIVKILAVLAVLFLVYWIHIFVGIPAILSQLEVFNPQFYALSKWLPSFGDFFLIAVLFFFWSLVFIREFSIEKQLKRQFIVPAYFFAGLLYQLVCFMIVNLICNGNITYKLNKITNIDYLSVSSYLAIAMLLFSVFLIHLKIIQRTEHLNRRNRFFQYNLAAVVVSIILCFLFPSGWSYFLTLFFAVNILQCQIKRMHVSLYSLSYIILFITLFSVFSLLVVYNTVKKREIEVQKLMAINLSTEQDPVAEVLLTRMQSQFNTDSIIPSLLIPPYDDLEDYLTRTYFSGYFRKYDIQYTFCTGTDPVLIQPENISEPCLPYFDNMIKKSGIIIPGSSFYFMNNMNGRVSYFGKFHYPLRNTSNGINVFIEINSRIISEGIGFPELLIDRSVIKPFRYKNLSYAKYFEEELVNRSGEYTYNFYLQSYNLKKTNSEFQLMKWDGYDHLIYTFDEKNHIIVSNQSLTFFDYLISFPYIFVFYFAFILIAATVGNASFRKLIIPHDLRFRIQGSIILVVLLSLLFMATGTIYYNIQEYRNRHLVDLQEKIKSISEEIKNRLIYVNSINPELQQWLFSELYKLSNIFRTDINIYDLHGALIATSRPEIFDKGIISERMNSKAFYALSERYRLNYFQPEKIGNLSYLSAYEPIINNKGDYLGYLNLPYFTREDDLKQSISTFIVVFINLYLILFLASVIIAILLSNKITQPLSLIREKLRSIQLGKKSEQINYQAEDEIGALVQEYNHKVIELAESAELLARSERESAWRDMAKQIAHEIKNPLTPMKLNIQYLQKAKEERNEHYDAFFERVTKNLIEQIDTLSGIATEFSNFAQMPQAKNEVFNLIEILQNVCSLFEPNQNLHFSLEDNHQGEVRIFADKEQLSRAFLNLIKNGIQSIPADQKGEIRIAVGKHESVVQVSISDNGAGISKEAQEHLFEPNFTTKTSGMGLGLSIVRNIITSFNGKIWHETGEAKGTTFFIEIPLYETSFTTKNNHS